jgi:hypothetical protein
MSDIGCSCQLSGQSSADVSRHQFQGKHFLRKKVTETPNPAQ